MAGTDLNIDDRSFFVFFITLFGHFSKTKTLHAVAATVMVMLAVSVIRGILPICPENPYLKNARHEPDKE